MSSLTHPFASGPGSHQAASAPAITLSPPNSNQSVPAAQSGLDMTDLEEPPPYTPSPSAVSGETTVEVGPRRPFQTAPSSTNLQLNRVPNQVTHSRIPSSSSSFFPSTSPRPSPLERTASVVQQLSDSFTHALNNFNSSASYSNPNNRGAVNVQPTGQSSSWSSYPGQHGPPPLSNSAPGNTSLVPPPRHPLSPSAYLRPQPLSTSTHSLPSMPNHSSDFARDFYAAGTGNGEALVSENIFAPPAGPPPSVRQASTALPKGSENTFAPPTGPPPSERQASTARAVLPNDGRPTSQPQPGHPLLKDGNLLVYPRGFECRKCHNVGYKDANPQKPCRRCWNRYAKPFSGPLAYSFPANAASSSLASNFQRPLPSSFSSMVSPIPAASSSSPPSPSSFRGAPRPHDGYRNPPISYAPPVSAPAGNPVTYMAGDPRIGGLLCQRCGGKGNVDILFFEELCPVCSGVGRVFV